MYAVIAQVTTGPNGAEESRTMIRDVILPRAKQLPGFAGGSWFEALDNGHGTAVMHFESEEDARAVAERIRSQGPLAGRRVDLENVEGYEVLYQT